MMFDPITDFDIYAGSLTRELWHLSIGTHQYDNVARFESEEDRAKVRRLHDAVGRELAAIRAEEEA